MTGTYSSYCIISASPKEEEKLGQKVTIRAGASYFKLVWPLVTDESMHKYEEARGVWGHAPPGKFFKIRHSEVTSETMFGRKMLLESAHL